MSAEITGKTHPIRNQTQNLLPILRAKSADMSGKLRMQDKPNKLNNKMPIVLYFNIHARKTKNI